MSHTADLTHEVHPGTQVRRGVFQHAAYAIAAALCLSPWVSAPLALAAGISLALTLGNPAPAATKRISKHLLQVSVVLMGFGIDAGVLARTGAEGLCFAAVTIGATLVLGHVLSRLAGI